MYFTFNKINSEVKFTNIFKYTDAFNVYTALYVLYTKFVSMNFYANVIRSI